MQGANYLCHLLLIFLYCRSSVGIYLMLYATVPLLVTLSVIQVYEFYWEISIQHLTQLSAKTVYWCKYLVFPKLGMVSEWIHQQILNGCKTVVCSMLNTATCQKKKLSEIVFRHFKCKFKQIRIVQSCCYGFCEEFPLGLICDMFSTLQQFDRQQ